MAPKKHGNKGKAAKNVKKDMPVKPTSVGAASFKALIPKKETKASKAAAEMAADAEHIDEVEELEMHGDEDTLSTLHQIESDTHVRKRRLQRRDTDQQVDRVRDTRLKMCSKAKFEGLEDEEGVSIREFLKQAIRQNRKTKKKFSCKFWVQLYERYPIIDDISKLLPEYHDPEAKICKVICEKLAILHNENPAARKSAPLEKFLSTCKELNVDEVLGLVRAIQESPVVTRLTMIKCCVALMMYFGRTGFIKKYPWLWDILKSWADENMACWYERMTGDGISLRSFCKKYNSALTLFIPEAHLAALRDAVLNKSDPDVVILQQELNKTVLAKSMFQTLGIRTSYLLHLRDISVRLVELENQDFMLSEVEAYRTVMARESELLVDSGYELTSKQKTLVGFMVEDMEVLVEEIGDIYHYNVEAKIVTAAVASGQLPKTAWERVLYPGKIPGERETLTLPEELLHDHRTVREEINEHLGTQPMTFAAMKSTLAPLWGSLRGLERTCDLEEKYLEDFAEKRAKEMIRKEIQEDCLPFEGKVPAIQDCIAQLKRIKNGALCMALGTTQLAEVNGILAMVENISKKVSIGANDVKQFNKFYQGCIKHMESWCMISNRELVPFAEQPTSSAPRGRTALMDHLADAKKVAAEQKGRMAMPMLQPFRTFGWMLDSKDARLVDSWTNQALVVQPLLCKALGDKSKGDEGGSESASSGPIVPLPKGIVAAGSKASSGKVAKSKNTEPVTSETMLKFFNRKKVA